jgi:preprotein translocase subunit SecG
MTFLSILLTFVYILVCVGLIFFVLIQSSKGSGLSGAFGALGGSDSLFGATGSYTLVVKISVGLAVGFLLFSVLFGFLPEAPQKGIMDRYASQYVTMQEAVDSSAGVDAGSVPTGDAGSVSPGGAGSVSPGDTGSGAPPEK